MSPEIFQQKYNELFAKAVALKKRVTHLEQLMENITNKPEQLKPISTKKVKP